MLTSPPPGHGRIEMEMSSNRTPPDGSRTKPGNLKNEGHVGGAYGCLHSAGGDAGGAPPGPCGRVAPRCVIKVNGKEVQREEYHDIRADVKLQPDLYDTETYHPATWIEAK